MSDANKNGATAEPTGETIDMTPTWGEVGLLFKRLIQSNEKRAIAQMWSEHAKAFAAAQSLQAIMKTLTDEQRAIVGRTMVAELSKQGF